MAWTRLAVLVINIPLVVLGARPNGLDLKVLEVGPRLAVRRLPFYLTHNNCVLGEGGRGRGEGPGSRAAGKRPLCVRQVQGCRCSVDFPALPTTPRFTPHCPTLTLPASVRRSSSSSPT